MARGFTTGAANYLATTSSPSDTGWLGALSVSVHAYILSGGGYRHFLGKHDGNGSGQNPVDFRTNNDGTPKLVMNRATDADIAGWDGPTVTLNAWRVYGFSQASGVQTTPDFYINGSKTAGGSTGGSGTGPATGTNANIRIGQRADGAVQMDGNMAEVAVWSVQLTDAEQAILGAGYSPLLVRPESILFYAPLIRADQDLVGGLALTATNAPTVESHPRVLLPRRRGIVMPTPSSGGTNTVTVTASVDAQPSTLGTASYGSVEV